MAAFDNIVFVQGDCLMEDKLPSDELLAECDSVVHMVGSITDAFNYKKVLQTFGNRDKVHTCIASTLRNPSYLLSPARAVEAVNWVKEVVSVD